VLLSEQFAMRTLASFSRAGRSVRAVAPSTNLGDELVREVARLVAFQKTRSEALVPSIVGHDTAAQCESGLKSAMHRVGLLEDPVHPSFPSARHSAKEANRRRMRAWAATSDGVRKERQAVALKDLLSAAHGVVSFA
jgi:hypothetical protein